MPRRQLIAYPLSGTAVARGNGSDPCLPVGRQLEIGSSSR